MQLTQRLARAGTAAPALTRSHVHLVPLRSGAPPGRSEGSPFSWAAGAVRTAKPGYATPRPSCVAAAGHDQHAASWTPFPWRGADYHRVSFVTAPYGPIKLFEDSRGGTFNGVLVFRRDADEHHSIDDLNVLEVFVAGDTAFNTWSLLTHRLTDRPMVHELMWTMMERAHGTDTRNWTLLRVAIVELRDNVFIGRLFFGDKESGEVTWDCDCRPSDGVYLGLRAQCDFFVHRRVWDQAALPVNNSSVYKLVASSTQHAGTSTGTNSSPAASDPPGSPAPVPATSSSSGYAYNEPPQYRSGSPGGGFGPQQQQEQQQQQQQQASEWQGRPANATATAESLTMEDVTLIRPDDPDAIKLLKRQLLVAVAEEDYRQAIRIRDHAWMHLFRKMHVLRLRGRYNDAHRVEMELKRQIEASASAGEQ